MPSTAVKKLSPVTDSTVSTETANSYSFRSLPAFGRMKPIMAGGFAFGA